MSFVNNLKGEGFTPWQRFFNLCFYVLLVFSSSLVNAQDSAIGRIITTTGNVQLRSPEGEYRLLRRGMEFFIEDIILTGEGGEVQLRFNDSAVVTLHSNSEFTVGEYISDGLGGTPDSIAMSLLKGGLRTISGTIGDDGQDSYSLETPFASIGIRGTDYEVLLFDGRFLFAVFTGAINVAPTGGSPTIFGQGGESDFGEVNEDIELIILDTLVDVLGLIEVGEVSEEELLDLPTPEEAEAEVIDQVIVPLAALVADEDANEEVVVLNTGESDEQNLENTELADGSGALIDEFGNVLDTATEEALRESQEKLIQANPGLFDETTREKVSPN